MSINRDTCSCRKVEAGYEFCLQAGDFYFKPRSDTDPIGTDLALNIRLPDGVFNRLPLSRGNAASNRVWGWDGNEDKPTLTPSIHCLEHWHGYLTKGVLHSC